MPAPSLPDLSGKVYVVTGANTGIGLATARALAGAGARVLVTGRTRERMQPVADGIIAETGNSGVEVVALDLGSLASVRKAAGDILERADRIDALVNNAGVAGQRGITADGFELHFGVNHLGHFLLTELLLDRLKASAPSRIVNVSSKAHYDAKGIDFGALRRRRPASAVWRSTRSRSSPTSCTAGSSPSASRAAASRPTRCTPAWSPPTPGAACRSPSAGSSSCS